MQITCVALEFCGKVKTMWVEGAGEDKKTLSGEEVLFQTNTVFFGERSNPLGRSGIKNSDGLLHKSGQTDYVFSCTFPRILPSSFESNFGSIRYFLKGKNEICEGEQKEFLYVHTQLFLLSSGCVSTTIKVHLHRTIYSILQIVRGKSLGKMHT